MQQRARPATWVLISIGFISALYWQGAPRANAEPGVTVPAPAAPLLFSAMRDRNADLYVLEPGAAAPRRLTDDSAQDNYGRWSPDGMRIAFQSRRAGAGEIFVVAAAGGAAVNVTNDPGWDVLPVWSPDGARLAFMSTRGFELGGIGPFPGHVYVMNADGSGLMQVTREPLTSSLGPSDWSPDGKTLLIGRVIETQIDLFALDVASGAETRLTRSPEGEYGAAWSPDGDWIACHVETDSTAQIAVLHADGSGRRLLTPSDLRRYSPRWSPDGAWLTYATEGEGGRQYDLRSLRVEDAREVVVLATAEDEREGDWMPAPAARAVATDSVSLGDDLYVRRIGEGLWLHVSTRVLDSGPAASNGVIVAGEKGVFVIDTPWENDQTARLLDWMDRAIGGPVLGFVLTHHHDDRMGGIGTVHARGIETWSSDLTAKRARKDGHPVPRHPFKRRAGLSTGTDSLAVFYPGPGHTRDNIVVWLPDRRILVGGCMIRSARTRSLGYTAEADLKRWPRSLGRVREICLNPMLVIPGHGQVGGMDAIENTEQLLRENAAGR